MTVCASICLQGENHLSLLDGVRALEPQLYDRLTTMLDEAVTRPNTTAHSVVGAVLKDKHLVAAEGDIRQAGASEEPEEGLSRLLLETATVRTAFRELTRALQDVGADSLQDKSSHSPLALTRGVRWRCVPCAQRKKLVSRHPSLLVL